MNEERVGRERERDEVEDSPMTTQNYLPREMSSLATLLQEW